MYRRALVQIQVNVKDIMMGYIEAEDRFAGNNEGHIILFGLFTNIIA